MSETHRDNIATFGEKGEKDMKLASTTDTTAGRIDAKARSVPLPAPP